jgi:prevent-host-death family protein
VNQVNLVNMAEQVNVQDAKTRLSELLARVEKGEEITIARAGRPVARLVAIGEPPPRELGFLKLGHIPDSFFDPLPEEELILWEGGEP